MRATRQYVLVTVITSLTLLEGCSSNQTASTPKAERGIFALHAESGAPGGEARVSLRTLSTAGEVVTVISEFDYDPSHLRVKDCVLNKAVAEVQPVAKSLNFGEPSPGVLRAMVVGSLEPLPVGEVFTCTFNVAPDAPLGAVTFQAHGDVSNAAFEDRNFATDGAVTITN